jgi:homocitrate synthase NifV
LGERAGNAALEQVVAGLNRFCKSGSNVDLTKLPRLADLVAAAASRPIPAGKAIVGSSAFTHESGIHVDGLLKDPATYESVSPATFGRSRQIVLGKHSGLASVTDALRSLGVFAEKERTQCVLDQVRQRSIQTKRVISAEELLEFYHGSSDGLNPVNISMEMRYDCA